MSEAQNLVGMPMPKPKQAPICPSCKSDPLRIVGRVIKNGPYAVFQTWCASCGCPVPCSVVGDARSPLEVPQPSGRIIL
jgi:hypothetical protein